MKNCTHSKEIKNLGNSTTRLEGKKKILITGLTDCTGKRTGCRQKIHAEAQSKTTECFKSQSQWESNTSDWDNLTTEELCTIAEDESETNKGNVRQLNRKALTLKTTTGENCNFTKE